MPHTEFEYPNDELQIENGEDVARISEFINRLLHILITTRGNPKVTLCAWCMACGVDLQATCGGNTYESVSKYCGVTKQSLNARVLKIQASIAKQ